ncbi:mitochondrial protein Pet127-domain-containing protein [Pilobolus umbonatus]|nr:mitochondrial protein Pet127-domain-containing protein [Pilobolus umbonatus]
MDIPVSTLAHGLDKVLFKPGVHYLKNPKTKSFNFTPFLENITQPIDFNFEALQPYITSSKDNSLIELAQSHNKRYVGSTSSVSSVLSHFYFVMSNFKPVDTACLSPAFINESKKFTRGTRVPASIYLRWKDGVYAVDVDKSYDVEDTVLSEMGRSLEKVLTHEPSDYSRYLKNSESPLPEEQRNQRESYAYGEMGNILLRSQLDCHHSRLKRGTFDLKTRAAVPVRLDLQNYTNYLGYSLRRRRGLYESFEREYYDMMRSAFLKYNFQVRIGHMDGILVAYHNTRKIFGFQYIKREEMDARLYGSSEIGDQVFRNALVMFESVLNEATKKYPNQTLRISFDTAEKSIGVAYTNIYVEAVPPEEENKTNKYKTKKEMEDVDRDSLISDPYDQISVFKLETKSIVNGALVTGPLELSNKKSQWNLYYQINELSLCQDEIIKRFRNLRKRQLAITLPSTSPNPMMQKFQKISEATLRAEAEGEAVEEEEEKTVDIHQ